MKKIPRKILPMLLLSLFAVGLLAVPASADEVVEEVELPPWMEAYLESVDYAALFGWSEQTAAEKPMCSHPKEIQPPVITCSKKDANEHYKVEQHPIYCSTCDYTWYTTEKTTELHIYNPYRQYAGSNHTGHYSLHTYSYRYTCASCGYAKIETFPTGCTAYGCVEPQSLDPMHESLSDDMIFGIYLD